MFNIWERITFPTKFMLLCLLRERPSNSFVMVEAIIGQVYWVIHNAVSFWHEFLT